MKAGHADDSHAVGHASLLVSGNVGVFLLPPFFFFFPVSVSEMLILRAFCDTFTSNVKISNLERQTEAPMYLHYLKLGFFYSMQNFLAVGPFKGGGKKHSLH